MEQERLGPWILMQQRVLERCMHQNTGLLRELLVLRIDPNRKDKETKFVKKKNTTPNVTHHGG